MTKKPAPEKTAITEDKKKRRKSWDRRKQPHIRAHMEVAKNHGLQGHRHTAFIIFWDCGGDWEKAEQWFEQPNVKAQNGDVWEAVWARAPHGSGGIDGRADPGRNVAEGSLNPERSGRHGTACAPARNPA